MRIENNILPIKILIAEDQETDAFFIEQAFGQANLDNEVFWVKNGQEAIDFLKKCDGFSESPRPDLIFLDIKMPLKDGHETLIEIKTDDDLRDIPVIMMSGSQALDDVHNAYRNHANAYVSKSNGFEDMLQFVDAIEKFWFLKAKLPQKRDA